MQDWQTNIHNETMGVTTDLTDIKKKIREYCEQLFTHKLDNLDEIDQLLKTKRCHKLPSINWIQSLKFPQRNLWAQMVVLEESTKIFKKYYPV